MRPVFLRPPPLPRYVSPARMAFWRRVGLVALAFGQALVLMGVLAVLGIIFVVATLPSLPVEVPQIERAAVAPVAAPVEREFRK